MPVTDEEQRRRVFTHVVDDLNQPHNPAGISQPTHLEDWTAGRPLVEIVFDGEAERTWEKHHGWSMTVGAAVRLPGDPAARSWAPTSSAWSRRRGASFPPRRLVGDLKAEHPALNLN